jgi:hypothetical protein
MLYQGQQSLPLASLCLFHCQSREKSCVIERSLNIHEKHVFIYADCFVERFLTASAVVLFPEM